MTKYLFLLLFLMAKKFFFAPMQFFWTEIIIHFFPRFSGHSAQHKIADVETKNLEKQPKAKNNNIAKYSKTKSDDLKKKKTEIFSNGGVAGSSTKKSSNENPTITNTRSFETKKKKTDSHLKSINGVVLKCELVLFFKKKFIY